MTRLFITGMARSGTTLLDKLLCRREEIDLLSQPFPLVFVDAKRRFLSGLGKNDYYVLNDDRIARDYEPGDFSDHLAGLRVSASEVDRLFADMATYSGQHSKGQRRPRAGDSVLQGFDQILEYCFRYFEMDATARFNGMKEIMCEEFLAYLGGVGYRCIVIVRDPRDVLASANYPKTRRYLGAKKPTLFLLRTWRKSVEYAHALRDQPYFHMLRYEDLVQSPAQALDELARFLGISSFRSEHLEREIVDRGGKPWLANSSGATSGPFISSASVGTHKSVLSESERAYAEAVCGREMRWLGYTEGIAADAESSIRQFRDHGVEDAPGLPADFSHRADHVAQELERLSASTALGRAE